ncbi:protein DNA-DAMAGE INDUCIBLE 1-like [Solanum verrucosum]|uniref:protein DNA-DAMAGE INDUCIBLE 1-like n=1 Tax=Solanum verrucosum TaxID=315347 RepID=UPI0020D119E2|nr:protein DNA-DAMAGE INDUCIBLE 1-like [Solanum verrucosum]
MSGHHGNTERKTEVANKGGCYICGGPHGYARCPELKSLGAILREWKEKDAQEQGQGTETTQLGLIGLCGAITNQPEKPRGYGAQYVDLKINGKPACALVDTGAEVNLMTKKAATRLGLSDSSSNAQLRTVNAPPTPVNGVAHGVSITLGEWQGKANFTVAPLDLFDIILGQEFFQQCHAVIDPYLQRLLVMEQGRSCMVPMIKVLKTEGQVRLTSMQLEKNPKKKESMSRATIASSKKDNGARRSLPPCMKKVPKENNVVMPKKPPRLLPPRKEVDRKTELEAIWKTLKALRKGLNRVNGLLVAHAQGSDDDVAAMRRGRRINRWGRVSRPATPQLNFASG